ncbi:hypothetical protein D9V32_02745 [Mycetocola tolaasinivorans]|uniref:Uncharacterized protein n=1 Tax=Mycetocola tolaasinivorans TaxID=76635 RepID=A0A3L7AA92_9MICO|nr:hypothetical protein [Mycetocola tolaasinivorans]RLP77386.1 hypothetical protein D9V32_02745 [Mycetocola tolaasinivorans]
MTLTDIIRSPDGLRSISRERLREAVRKSTRASAALEGRVIPEDYVRPEWVTKFLAAHDRLG